MQFAYDFHQEEKRIIGIYIYICPKLETGHTSPMSCNTLVTIMKANYNKKERNINKKPGYAELNFASLLMNSAFGRSGFCFVSQI